MSDVTTETKDVGTKTAQSDDGIGWVVRVGTYTTRKTVLMLLKDLGEGAPDGDNNVNGVT